MQLQFCHLPDVLDSANRLMLMLIKLMILFNIMVMMMVRL